MSYQSLNPATGKLLKKFVELTDKELETKIAAAGARGARWGGTGGRRGAD